ncbi:MAG: VWA domain-containing protein [Nitrososphaerota archaeon]|nr:VWA domain-containing protein [Nitrososphaerota archaeon]
MPLYDEADGANHAAAHLLGRLVQFSSFLRESGLEVTTTETLDAVSSVLLVDMADRSLFYRAMRAALVKRSEDYALFDRAFERFWTGRSIDSPTGRLTPMTEPNPSARFVNPARGSRIRAQRTKPAGVGSPLGTEAGDMRQQLLAFYSPAETLGKKTFRNSGAEYSSLLKRNLKKFSRRVATRPGRRLVPSESGEVDLRRTFRAGRGTGGQFLGLERRRRKISKSSIVLLCDISGSMDSHSDQLMRLLHLCCNTSLRTEVFAFSTRLVRLNRFLEGRSLLSASQLVSENVNFWSSGTRIGSALGTLLSHYSGSLRSSTVLVVISDGWELDDLEVLDANLRSVRRRVKRVIWLNPLADNPGYEPLAAGIKTAMPYIDVFAGLKIFTDRREFERVLGKSIAPPA